MEQLKQQNILVTVGDDEEAICPTLKVWRTDKTDKTGNPLCLRAIRIPQTPPVPVTCLAVMEDLALLAVGLCNGVVIVFHDIQRDRTPKQTLLKPDSDNPVTGLGFSESRALGTSLFVTTTDSVVAYRIDQRHTKEVLDDRGCELNCAVMSDANDLCVARSEAVYFYEAEGRGPCFAFEGEKKIVAWFRGYLIVVGQDEQGGGRAAAGPSTAAPAAPATVASSSAGQPKMNTLTIYDLKNKFVACRLTFQSVTHIVSEWGSIFVLTQSGTLFQLEEKDTQTKLETLFKRNLYPVAIALAHSQNYDYNSIIDIFRKYGDHLYGKGDYDGAIRQYLRTIGRLEPSYVIRKFLDAQRIHNLTSYLQALHEKGLANPDHTTLLLNCYTKLKDVQKLDEFIKTDSDAMKFEVETAIKVCRQAGYYEHALYLARRHNEHDWYIKILLEDLKDYQNALEYITTLNFYEAEKNLKNYGKILVSFLPKQTTDLLMDLCTNYKPKRGQGDTSTLREEQSQLSHGTKAKAAPEEFIHIYVKQPEWLTTFLEFIVTQGEVSSLIYNTLLELYLRHEEGQSPEDRLERLKKAQSLLVDPRAHFDEDHALVLAQMQDFRQGILHLYEKLELYHEIVQYYMENNEYEAVIECCKKYGDKDPNLWVQALSYFAGRDEDCQAEIIEVLNNIDRDNLLPPLLVIQILSQKSTTTLSVVKDYIVQRLQQQNQLIAEDQRLIRMYSDETDKMRREMHELKTGAKIFQEKKCTGCTGPLDLPSIHFLCMHSFHQRCLGENEKECPVCAPNNRKISEIKKALEENAGQHDQFFKQLEGSADGFQTVAEYFGRGIFSPAGASSSRSGGASGSLSFK
ncbi:Vacuolar protein sorting-associated protein 11 [Balamuthia mandrillaris]